MTTFGVVILAAGKGKRMNSPLPKVLHEICGEPLLFHILNKVRETAPNAPIAIVVGYGREQVQQKVSADPRFAKMQITFVHQQEQRGTGHATKCAMDSEWGKTILKEKSAGILVLPGDLPLITSSLVQQMTAPLGRSEAVRLLTSELSNPTGYGRIVRKGKKGKVLRIVEEKDANLREKSIREVGASIYFFQAPFLRAALEKLSPKNAQGEYYLTDAIGQAAREKRQIVDLIWQNEQDLRGINDNWELAIARKIMNERILRDWATKGVNFIDPDQTWIDVTVELSPNVTIGPGVMLLGKTRIDSGAVLGARVILKDTQVHSDAIVKAGTVGESSTIGSKAQIGPYAHLRPESFVGNGAKIGNFVELKKTKVGDHTSIAHLSYLGDAEVGQRVNIGCGFITCNFDGRVIEGQRKHKTTIGDDVFLGSDCQTVAPVKIGNGAYIASGSTITEDVEPESLAIARTRQVNKPGYAKKMRNGAKES